MGLDRGRRNAKTVFIYLLRDPLTKVIGYVGVTVNPRNRYLQHIRGTVASFRASKNIKRRWIGALCDKAVLPSIEIIEEVCRHDGGERERFWQREIFRTKETIDGFLEACDERNGREWCIVQDRDGKYSAAVVGGKVDSRSRRIARCGSKEEAQGRAIVLNATGRQPVRN